ncbi:amidase, Asp-tRNAAsn/Glu-tRNAGln amidotransferase A subunit [Opitutaceae bacterium TAV1]|nr:amidase, Asp-tRNAAsn/Glu-tRNAGln amidotransferase A subunit [Opitutaceae bacterium TAV1]
MKSTLRFLLALLALAAPAGARAAEIALADATIAELNAAFSQGTLTAEKLTGIYLARIAAYDKQGPAINAVITLNPRALEEARARDAERREGKVRGPLHGIPIVLKDNYDTFDLPTTAGSQLLEGSIPPDDAFVVKKLRDAGVVILAKVNLGEFASGGGSVSGATDPAVIKAGTVPNGFSSMGLQTLNPHDLARGPAGSSGGTGASIAAAFAQFGLGTDTAASVRGPSSANGIVGLKTTHGLLSRDGVVPLALTFDTVGPMARSVYDVAVALGAMTGVDPADDSTRKGIGQAETDYTQFLRTGSLKGARIGIARDFTGQDPEVDRIVEEAIVTLGKRGAVIVDPVRFPDFALQSRQGIFNVVRTAEFKAQIADYLKTLGPGYPKTLDDLAARANDPGSGYRSPEKAYALNYSATTALDLDDPVYLAARNQGVALIKATVEAVFDRHQLDAILYPTSPRPASLIVPVERSGPREAGSAGAGSALNLANLSGFPDLVIPAGLTGNGLPVTISFLGRAFSEARLLGYGYDFEQATRARVLPKHTPALPGDVITY